MEALIPNPTLGRHGRPLLPLSCRELPESVSGLTQKKKKSIFCTGNVTTSSGLSSVLSERNAVIDGKGLLHGGSLVLQPNGMNPGEKGMNDLTPFNGTATTMVEMDEGIGIVKFLKGKRFLVTGATGFVGKVLLEKILRTAPDVGKIFLLIKAQSREAALQRVKDEIINTELFKCLREIHGSSYQGFMLSKLFPLVGDVREADLGMEAEVADAIAEEVDVIINSAANTTFDERYDVALDMNTKGPCRVMNFAKSCKNLKLFLHVSTAYVNGQREGRIREKAFSIGDSIAREKTTQSSSPNSLPVLNVQAEMEFAVESQLNSLDNSIAQKMKEMGLQRSRIHGWQDTYVFTKAMGEMMINTMRGEIPVVVIRPSVIESTYRDPFPGWIQGNRMLDPILLNYGKGQLTGFLADPNGVVDVVPVDMVVNATLAAMAKHGRAGKAGIQVYHIASSVTNPLVLQDLVQHLFQHFSSYPYMDSKGNPIRVPTMKLFHSMDDFAAHIWTDAQAVIAASPKKFSQRLESICRKYIEQAKHLANIYEPYAFYMGKFDNTNTQKLMEGMSEEERRCFDFDVGSIDWEDYIANVHIPGLRRHVMKGRGTPDLL